jgi:hypothetical protein
VSTGFILRICRRKGILRPVSRRSVGAVGNELLFKKLKSRFTLDETVQYPSADHHGGCIVDYQPHNRQRTPRTKGEVT